MFEAQSPSELTLKFNLEQLLWIVKNSNGLIKHDKKYEIH